MFRTIIITSIYILLFWVFLPVLLIGITNQMDLLIPVPLPSGRLSEFAGVFLVAIGATIMFLAARDLWIRGNGLPISHLPPTQFVVKGLYGRFRHPIYVGYTLAFAGLGFTLGSFWAISLGIPLLISCWLTYVWTFEEPRLLARFGEDYANYRNSVGLFGTTKFLPLLRVNNNALSSVLNWLARDPVLIRVGPIIVVKYGVYCAVGAFLMAGLVILLFRQVSIDSASIRWFMIVGVISVGIVSWIFWWVPRWRHHITLPYFGLTENGFVSYGGLAGLFAVALYFSYSQKISFWLISDIITLSFFLPYIFGRIGCLVHGCCWGAPSNEQPSVTYWHNDAKVNRLGAKCGIPRYPTQLYSAIHGLVCFIAVYKLAIHSPPVGTVTGLSFAIFAAGRTAIDSWRDDPRIVFGSLNYSQLGAIVLFVVGIFILFVINLGKDSGRFLFPQQVSLIEITSAIPMASLCFFIILLVFGFHWKRIGSWGG